ncbi:YjcZ family sporulation protein [Bacillus sp. F19]|nr:YjcZ family sporulation protein [Bacillus sp. F19]
MQMGDKGFGYGSGFALIVVLFILLIIVGAACLY